MCGITGIFAFARCSDTILNQQYVARMNETLVHRGPDDQGLWVDEKEGVYLGHRRLSILDLSERGHQPMVAPDGTVIVFNGEVYNFQELRRGLSNYPFQSDTDTETILALYREKGPACLDDLVGMFSLAIWDPRERGLFLARDRIGKKPLYYTYCHKYFAFASEIRALLTLPWVTPRLNEESFYHLLTFGFPPPPTTMFEGIFKLEQGYSLWVDAKGVKEPQRYWSIPHVPIPGDEAGLVTALRRKLDRSVDLRMVSDVPVGIFLSGGVDSTGLATLMRRKTGEDIHSFSISFADEPDYDEAKVARATAMRLSLVHHEYVVTPDDMQAMIAQIADVLDEPLVDPTCIPIYFLSKMAHDQGIKVVLTGDGPDELFLGYRNWGRYLRAYPLFRLWSRMPQYLQKVGLWGIEHLSSSPRLIELFHRASLGQELFWGSARSFRESEKKNLLSLEFANRARAWSSYDVIKQIRKEYDQFAQDNSCLGRDANWMAYIGLRFNIPNFYMHRADRLGMRHSVELRSPYLDHNLVSFALSVPAKWKVKNGKPKYLLKKAFEGLVPNEILYGAKKGFCVPLREWGGELMVETVMDGISLICDDLGLMKRSLLEDQVHRFRNGEAHLTSNMWTLYFLTAWLHRWMK